MFLASRLSLALNCVETPAIHILVSIKWCHLLHVSIYCIMLWISMIKQQHTHIHQSVWTNSASVKDNCVKNVKKSCWKKVKISVFQSENTKFYKAINAKFGIIFKYFISLWYFLILKQERKNQIVYYLQVHYL